MKKLLLIIMALFAIVTARATPQARDVLYWNGNKYSINSFIDIEKRMNTYELNNLNAAKTATPPTSNYRGYSLEFEIFNDTLYLIAIKDSYKTDLTGAIIGNLSKKPMLDFSDTLFLGYGESFYDPAWLTMVNESEITVIFKNGVVQWYKDNKSKSKSSPYYPFDIPYIKKCYSNIHWSCLDKETLQKKPAVVLRIENDSINIAEKVSILRSSGFAEFDEEAVRVIKTIPLPVSFVKGKYLHHNYQVPIIFDTEKAKKLGVYNETAKTNDIFEDQLVLMLQDCIKESKTKYESSYKKTTRNYNLVLCYDGLPSPFISNNELFYKGVEMDVFSWNDPKKYKNELKHGLDIMEVYHTLEGNTICIYVSIVTAKKEGKRITADYWFEDVDKYVYEYSCETNEWSLIKKE